jgi:hypothetical protein
MKKTLKEISEDLDNSMSEEEKKLVQARQYLIEAKEAEEKAKRNKSHALKMFSEAGYCDCPYPYYAKDKKGNCTVCKKPSRESLLKTFLP